MSAIGLRRLPRWRTSEFALLGFPSGIALLGLAAVQLAREGELGTAALARALAFAAMLFAAHAWLSLRYPGADRYLLPIGGALIAIGAVVMERLEPALANRQLIWLGVSFLLMAVALTLLPSVRWLRQWRYSSAALGLALVGLTFALGIDPNQSGARLWLGFGGVYFQPSELLKLLLVIFFASYLDDKRELLAWGGPRWGIVRLPPIPYLAPLVAMLVIAVAVVILQRDLGAALLYFGVFLALLYVASGRGVYVVLGMGAFLLGGALLFALFDHVQIRVAMWLNPWLDPDGRGYQIIQALVGMASGGVVGAGLTYGYPSYIPAVHTDFVIAAIGEELGLVGSLGTVGLYALLCQRGLAIALRSGDSFASLLATGLTVVISLQALVILGGTLRLIPLTGITLPFVSYGGSSLLVNTLMLGLLLAISAETEESERG